MAVDALIARSLSTLRRWVLKTTTNINEVDVYARRLRSYDRLTPKELALYVTRRRQALLFFATQNDPDLRAWKDAHPDEARVCSEKGWASIPTGELPRTSVSRPTVAQQANAARVLGWWSKPEHHHVESGGKVTSRLKFVAQPTDLRRVVLQDPSAEVSCLCLDEHRILAAPCPEAGEHHFLSDVFFMESYVSEHSQREEQYLTDLDSRTERLVRRRVPMKVVFKTELCACGRPFPIIKIIE